MDRREEAFAAFVANVGAGVVVALVTEKIEYALAAVIATQWVLIATWLTKTRKPGIPGVADVRTSSPEGRELAALTEQVTSEFAFWGISAKSMLSNDTFNAIMIKKARGGCRFRFLIMSPMSSAVVAKANEEGDTPEGWIKEIEANVLRLARLKGDHRLNIEARTYDEYPTFRCLFINSETVHVGWYPLGAQGRHSPFWSVHNSPTSLYHPLRSEFETLWQRAEPV